MQRLTGDEVLTLFLALGTLLVSSRILSELARALNQPGVLGEIIAGILLGPTVLGSLAPEFIHTLFPPDGPVALTLDGFAKVAIVMFLLVAGMEVDLSSVWRQGRTAVGVGIAGIALPFSLGCASALVLPSVLAAEGNIRPGVFALFFATAMSISALPVIARTLMDLNLYRSDLGMIVIAAAVFDDLTGWILFAVVMGLAGAQGEGRHDVTQTALLTVGFAAAMLTVGRSLIHRLLPWLQAHTSWPGGILGTALTLSMFGAAFTQWLGVHAVFGSFLVGVAIGDSSHLREHTRTVINQFVSSIFAPLFFATIGLRIDFVAHFDLRLVVIVLAIACVGKVLGCTVGARAAGVAPREAWAIGFAMNARGAMEIILGTLALQHGLIRERMFVALVIMALVTSMLSGPMMQKILRLKRPRHLAGFLEPGTFVRRLEARSGYHAIGELSAVVAAACGLESRQVEHAVATRERLASTGIGNGVAVPHARIPGLPHAVVGLGLSEAGVDFNAPDGRLAHVICLILTPVDDDGAQIEILSDIARTFGREEMRQRVFQVGSYTELLALLRTNGS